MKKNWCIEAIYLNFLLIEAVKLLDSCKLTLQGPILFATRFFIDRVILLPSFCDKNETL